MTQSLRLAFAALALGLVLPSVSQAHLFLDWYTTSPGNRRVLVREAVSAGLREEAAEQREALARRRAPIERELLDCMGGEDRRAVQLRSQLELLDVEDTKIRNWLAHVDDLAKERSEATATRLGASPSQLPDDDRIRRFLTELADDVFAAALKPMTPDVQKEVRERLVDAFLAVQFLRVSSDNPITVEPKEREGQLVKATQKPPRAYGAREIAVGILSGSAVTLTLALKLGDWIQALGGGGSTAFDRVAAFVFLTAGSSTALLAARAYRSWNLRRRVQFTPSMLTPLEKALLLRQVGLFQSFTDRLSSKMGGPASAMLHLRRLVGEGFERLADPMALLSSGQGMSFCWGELLGLGAAASQLPAGLDREVTP